MDATNMDEKEFHIPLFNTSIHRATGIKSKENKMNIALWIVAGLLAAMYIMTGGMKAFTPSKAKEQLPWAKRHSDAFIRFVGAAELLGALGLVLPLLTGILPWLTPLAAVGLALVQLLAIFMEHVPNKETRVLAMNVVLLLLAAFVAYGRFFILPA
jgi:uncharacterized membrane protein YphA (DoxX/SURF4 family)